MPFPSIPLIRTPFAYWRGLIYLKLDKLDEAEECFKASAEAAPAHAESWFKQGLILCKKKEWHAAFPHVQNAVFLDLERADWQRQLHNIEGRLEAGRAPHTFLTSDEIQERIDTLGETAFLYSQLAWALRKQSDWWQQVEALRSAVELDDGDARLHFRLGHALAGMRRFGEAAVEFERAVKLSPGNADWCYLLGKALSESGETGGKARHYFEIAVTEKTKKRLKGLGIGGLHHEAGNWVLAAEALARQVAEIPEDARLHFYLGDSMQNLYRWPEAAEAYRKALALDNDRPKWHYRLGFVNERLENLADAADSYSAAIGKSPEPAPLWNYRLGFVLERLGRLEDACAAYRQAEPEPEVGNETPIEKSKPRSLAGIEEIQRTDVTDPLVWAELGELLEGAEKWREAADAYFQAVSRSGPHQAEWYHRRGCCLAEVGEFVEACASFRSVRILQRPHGVSQGQFRRNAGVRTSASFTEYFEIMETNPRKVLFDSFHGEQMSCNPFAIFLEMLEDPAYRGWTFVWAINEPERVPKRFKPLRNVFFVPKASDGYLRHVTTAGVLVNNMTFPPYFIRRKEQLYLNTWHGTPWKTLGKDDVGQDFMVYGNLARNLLHATHVISSNEHTTRVLMEKFDIGHLFGGVIAETGYPRIDLTLNASEAEKRNLKARLGLTGERKVLFYAPTWRGKLGQIETNAGYVLRDIGRLAGTGCQILYRGHFLGGELPVANAVPEDISTNELLAVVDILVTDYSSVAFDFMATGRPIVYYLNDFEEYKRDRGLYFGVDELPGRVCYDLEGVCSAVADTIRDGSNVDERRYAAARRRFCPMEDGSAAKRVIDFLFSPPAASLAKQGGHQVLMFPGGFQPNGVTTSLINLLRNLDYTKLTVTLAFQPWQADAGAGRQEQLQLLPAQVRALPRVGGMDLTVEERWVIDDFNTNHGFSGGGELWEIYSRAHAREYIRLFGHSRFDAAVEFSGYSSFWASLFAFAPEGAIQHRAIYQHNDKYGEWTTRFPQLERIFRLYPHFDRLISVCEPIQKVNRDSLAELFELPRERFDYCENMLDPAGVLERAEAQLDPKEEADLFGGGHRIFVSIARLSVEKDHEKLIRAFAKLCETRGDIRLLVVGDGPLMPVLKRLVGRLGMEERVRLLGYRLNPFPYLKRAACFVMSSNYEGQGLVLFEAMILGIPIISTDIAACRSVVEGRSGLLVENSAEGLFHGMEAFLNGEIEAGVVNLDAYRSGALAAFYAKTCNLAADMVPATESPS